MTKYYKVAGHVFGMTAEPAHLEDCANYEPFGCSDEDDAVFMLRVESGEAPVFTEEMRQEDEGLHQTENDWQRVYRPARRHQDRTGRTRRRT